MKITTIKVDYYVIPLEGNLVDALHGKHDNFELVVANVMLDKELAILTPAVLEGRQLPR